MATLSMMGILSLCDSDTVLQGIYERNCGLQNLTDSLTYHACPQLESNQRLEIKSLVLIPSAIKAYITNRNSVNGIWTRNLDQSDSRYFSGFLLLVSWTSIFISELLAVYRFSIPEFFGRLVICIKLTSFRSLCQINDVTPPWSGLKSLYTWDKSMYSVAPTGIDPGAFRSSIERSTNWATVPYC